jgi:rhodanese-related sulfurtransferase
MQETFLKTIAPGELHTRILADDSLELLDVRTPPEYVRAHVPGSGLIPLNTLDAGAFLKQHQPGKPLYVLCQGGARARKAIEKLERAGCNDCVLVEGGTQAWIDAGLPVNRGVSNVLPIMRQVQITVGLISSLGALLALLVNPLFAVVPLAMGCGLLFAGLTGTCGMALLLARMPWNREQTEGSDCCTPEGL